MDMAGLAPAREAMKPDAIAANILFPFPANYLFQSYGFFVLLIASKNPSTIADVILSTD